MSFLSGLIIIFFCFFSIIIFYSSVFCKSLITFCFNLLIEFLFVLINIKITIETNIKLKNVIRTGAVKLVILKNSGINILVNTNATELITTDRHFITENGQHNVMRLIRPVYVSVKIQTVFTSSAVKGLDAFADKKTMNNILTNIRSDLGKARFIT